MSDSPVPTPANNETSNEQTNTHQQASTETTNTHTKKDSFQNAVDEILKRLKDVFKNGNERQLVLKNKMGSSVFRLPLIWAIVIGLFSFVIQIVPILVIAVVIALVTKHRFVIESNTTSV